VGLPQSTLSTLSELNLPCALSGCIAPRCANRGDLPECDGIVPEWPGAGLRRGETCRRPGQPDDQVFLNAQPQRVQFLLGGGRREAVAKRARGASRKSGWALTSSAGSWSSTPRTSLMRPGGPGADRAAARQGSTRRGLSPRSCTAGGADIPLRSGGSTPSAHRSRQRAEVV